MTRDAKDQLTRWGKILGILAGLVVLASALTAAGDDRYVKQQTYKADQAKIDGKLDRMLDVVCEGKEHTRACQP